MNDTNKEHIDQLITDCLTGCLDEEGMRVLKEWRIASPEHEAYYLRSREAWFSAVNSESLSRYDKEKAYERFRQRIATTKKERRLSVRWWHYAAVALILLVGGVSYWLGKMDIKNSFADISVEAPWGARTKLYLTDGTLVWLNAGSRMTYSQGFGVENREVDLEGEGYFEVKRNESLPFRVHSKDLRLEVLGTKFNFRDYPTDKEVVVSLLQGRVAVSNLLKSEPEMLLAPNERVVLDKAEGRMKVEPVTASNASEWTEGYLFFDEELLPDIVQELERSYDVQIHLADTSLNHFRFYGNFIRREQTIREVMEVLSSTDRIDFRISGRDVTVYDIGTENKE